MNLLPFDETRTYLSDAGIIVHDPDIPVYKYTDFEGAKKILEGCSLRFATPESYNDPFELHRSFIDLTFERDHLNNELSKFLRANNPGIRDEVIHRLLMNVTDEEHLHTIENKMKELREKSLLLCLSEKNNDTLMWSHYANKHTGICIGIRMPHWDKEKIMNVFKVNYTDKITPYRLIDPDKRIGALANFYWAFTKSKVWSYEREVRAIIPADIIKLAEGDKFSIIGIDNKQIVEIYYGIATPKETIVEIEKIIKDKKYNIEKRGKMEIVYGSFDVTIKDV